MFGWLRQRIMALFTALWRNAPAFIIGVMLTATFFQYMHLRDQVDRTKECLPEVREYDAQQLPPNAKNLRGLGNRWLLFDLEVNGSTKTFIFRRGYYRDQPDVLTQVK